MAVTGELDVNSALAQLANARYASESAGSGSGTTPPPREGGETLTVLTSLAEVRAAGVPGGYERLKEFTRGRAIDAAAFAAFVETLPLAQSEKARLKALRPADYVGLAAQLARQV